MYNFSNILKNYMQLILHTSSAKQRTILREEFDFIKDNV